MEQWLQHGTAGFVGGFASSLFAGCAGLYGVFPTIFVLYLNYLPSEALSLMLLVLSL